MFTGTGTTGKVNSYEIIDNGNISVLVLVLLWLLILPLLWMPLALGAMNRLARQVLDLAIPCMEKSLLNHVR
jgi:hypothetical protein